MSIEWNEEKQDWEFDGLTADEMASYQNITDDTLTELGLLNPDEASQMEADAAEGEEKLEKKHQNPLTKLDSFMGYTSPKADKTYEKLNPVDTAIDVGKAVGAEALHLVQKQQTYDDWRSFLNVLPDETHYEAKTHLAENLKYLYRYGAGLVGVGKFGAALKGAKVATGIAKSGKIGSLVAKGLIGTGKVLTADFKALQGTSKLAKAGKIATSGIIDGFVGDFIVGRPEEGEGLIGDIFPESDNPILQYLSTDTNDSGAEWRFKNALQGFIPSIPLNFAIHGAGKVAGCLFNQFKGLKSLFKAETTQEADKAIQNIQVAEAQTDNLMKGQELIDEVQKAYDEAFNSGIEDIERHLLFKDFVTEGNVDDVMSILQRLEKGQTVIPNTDGTFSIQVTKWQDAADVSIDELKHQTNNDGIPFMDESVKDTWTERGIINDGDSIYAANVKGKPVLNTSVTDKIVKHYADKWDLDTKSIVIKDNTNKLPQGVEGRTQTLSYKKSVNTKLKDIKLKIKEEQLNKKIQDLTNKTVKQKVKDLKFNTQPMKSYIKGRYKNKFFTKSILTPLESGINEANKKIDEIIQKISKNPEIVKNENTLKTMEDELAKITDFGEANKELTQLYYERFYEAIGTAATYKNTSDEAISILKKQLEAIKTQQADKAIEKPSKVVIELSANTQHPFAVLRSELEHARDYLKGTNPPKADITGSGEHFSRYKGDNESEASLEYVKHKADNRAGKTTNVEEKDIVNKQETQQPTISNTQEVTPNTVNKQITKEVETVKDTRPISERQQTIKSCEQANQILDEVRTNEKIVIPWKVNGENANKIYNDLKAKGIDNLAGIKEALSQDDVAYVNMVAEKQLAFERIKSDLKAKLDTLPDTATKEIDDILKSISYIQDTIKQLAGGYARGLNAQKFVNKTRTIFSLSTMEEMGLENIAQLLSVDIKSLNFTRGIPEAKRELYEKMAKYGNGRFLQEITKDSSVLNAFDKHITKLVQDKADIQTILQSLRDFANPIKRRDILAVAKQAPNPTVLGKLIQNIQAAGGIRAYIIHNLLGNPTTTEANIASGALNSLYFPMNKMLAGYLGGGENLTKEGRYTIQAMQDTFTESWQMCLQAWKTGKGKLVSLGGHTPQDLEADKYTGLNEWGTGTWFQKLQNFHSIMTRAMGASDEFITQMNYRSICKAKARIQAENVAEKVGRSNDKEWIKEQADKNFLNAFNAEGKPLDVDAYAEARDIVYQTPLSGKIWNEASQDMKRVKEQTVLMGISEWLTQGTIKHPALTFFTPFIRTPVNIAQMALEHNPLYAICSPSQRKLIFGSGREAAIARSKVLFGIGSSWMAMNLASMGIITGSAPVDEKERAALFKTGWKPYSFKIGDKYYSYSKVEPLCTILGFGADGFNLWQNYNTDEEATDKWGRLANEGIQALVNSSLDKTSFPNLVTQLATFINLVQGTDNTRPQDVARSLQMFLPMNAGVQSVMNVGTTQAKKPNGFWEALVGKYFVRGGMGDYKRNIWGERQDVYNYILYQGSKGLDENTVEDNEIMRLASLGWKPVELANNEYGTTIKYKDFRNPETGRTFYDAMLEEMSTIEVDGKTLREAVRDEIESPEYQTSDDGLRPQDAKDPNTRKNRLAAIFNQYKKAAKNYVIDEKGEDFVNKAGLTASQQREKDREEEEVKRLNSSLENTLQQIRSFS